MTVNDRVVILPNFRNPNETKCKCGCGLEVEPAILILVQAFIFFLVRKFKCRISFEVHSGARCPKHNKDEGGEDNSQHVKLCALDGCFFMVSEDGKRTQISNATIAKLAIESYLFTGIGYQSYVKQGKNLVHLDCRTGYKTCIW